MGNTGRLKLGNGDARLNGSLLARKGAPDPFGAASDFLTNLGLTDGQCIKATGENGTVGDKAVFFIDSATGVDDSLCARALRGATAEQVTSFALTSQPSPASARKKKSSKRKAQAAKQSKRRPAIRTKKRNSQKPEKKAKRKPPKR
jgi:hypothetical protein